MRENARLRELLELCYKKKTDHVVENDTQNTSNILKETIEEQMNLQKKLENKKKEISRILQNNDELKKSDKNKNDEIIKLKSDLQKKHLEIDSIQKEKNYLQEQIQHQLQIISSLHRDNKILLGKNDDNQNTIIILGADITEKEKIIGENEIKNAGLRQEIDVHVKKIGELESNISIISDYNTTYINIFHENKQNNIKLCNYIDEQREIITNLEYVNNEIIFENIFLVDQNTVLYTANRQLAMYNNALTYPNTVIKTRGGIRRKKTNNKDDTQVVN